ncbi:hypothetical protein SH668x_003171 [Planctomicrobium sp. SH668]|uniref:hypothetical protein n=1 Tax=Planctomicrobium sp. SH668 TaxID=3448126 RepID=UPI003F5AFE36
MTQSEQPHLAETSPLADVVERPAPGRRKKTSLTLRMTLLPLLIFAMVSAGVLIQRRTDPESPTSGKIPEGGAVQNVNPASENPATDEGTTSTTAAQQVELTGHWLLDESIRREIWVNQDGTAKMHIRLDLLASFLYGTEMELELRWKEEDGVLTHTIVAGTPKENVDRLVRDFGDSRSYNIVRVDDSSLKLVDTQNSDEVYLWKRLR